MPQEIVLLAWQVWPTCFPLNMFKRAKNSISFMANVSNFFFFIYIVGKRAKENCTSCLASVSNLFSLNHIPGTHAKENRIYSPDWQVCPID